MMSTMVHQEPLCATHRDSSRRVALHRGGTIARASPYHLSSPRLYDVHPRLSSRCRASVEFTLRVFSIRSQSCYHPRHVLFASSRRIQRSSTGSRKRTDSQFLYFAFNSTLEQFTSKTRRYSCICIIRHRIRKRRGLVGLIPMFSYASTLCPPFSIVFSALRLSCEHGLAPNPRPLL